ncbi:MULTISPECIES: 6-carboxytetrahydropterin synthase [Prochlorococcus]|uniref:6-carboxytetrahydropterin synthase n=1 Tax=Prochlorococcus TaxID=1218 RepID=UPI000533BCDB|nr:MULTISPECIES: 6-carboxytetrahydropterin synthase [Prochlorococcus]KGG12807.1 Queuosine biosynthesis QueD [Prochlorococcus sp. MIT 0601]
MSIKNKSYSCSKRFEGFPCCHRQWRHAGHCKFVHGYSRSFRFWFSATKLDENGFIVDFSNLQSLQEKLKEHFDHTFLVNSDDPLLSTWKELHSNGALDLRIMKNVGMESTAELIWGWANSILLEIDKGRTCCTRTEAAENDFNAACFSAIPEWFKFD